MASSLGLLFLLLGSTRAPPPPPPPPPLPRISFLLNSPERPLVHFSLSDVSNATTLLLSNDSSTLYVGARNAILSLDVSRSDVISLRSKVAWSPSDTDRGECVKKRSDPEVDCQNFVHVVQPVNSTHLYVCGSNAYNPQQAFMDVARGSVGQQDNARGRCPFSPFERSAAVVIDQELFAATTTDFLGKTPQISRFLSKDGRPDISLDSISLLQEPTFVSASLDPAGQKLYFFFSEIAEESGFVDKLQVPRVAQVCKDDVGGQRILQKKWTSFAKSALLCRFPFNILEDMFALQPPEGADASETLFYGVFSSQWSRRPESAVCTFKLKDIRDVFAGTFKTLEKETYQLKHPARRKYLGQCGLSNSSDSDLSEVRRNFLTGSSVRPVGPVLVAPEQKYSRLVVMKTTAADGRRYQVLFLLTESGFLHKAVPSDRGLRVVEEIQVFREPQRVQSMVLSSSQGLVYVGSSEGVTAVPVARCQSYRSCRQCVLARDPLCGWSLTRRTCTALDGADGHIVQTLEDVMEAECQQAEQILQHQDVLVSLGDVVTLRCVKPSNLAALNWTSADGAVLSNRTFFLAADGSLRFLASAATVGRYECRAEEGGVREVVASYDVHSAFSPRHLARGDPAPATPDPEERSVWTEEPAVTGPASDPPAPIGTGSDPEQLVTQAKGDAISVQEIVPTSRKDSRVLHGPAPTQRSYHSELVVVSLLLAACVLILALGAVRVWRRRRTGSDRLPAAAGTRTNTSLEIHSLSGPEDAGPDRTVIP